MPLYRFPKERRHSSTLRKRTKMPRLKSPKWVHLFRVRMKCQLRIIMSFISWWRIKRLWRIFLNSNRKLRLANYTHGIEWKPNWRRTGIIIGLNLDFRFQRKIWVRLSTDMNWLASPHLWIPTLKMPYTKLIFRSSRWCSGVRTLYWKVQLPWLFCVGCFYSQ